MSSRLGAQRPLQRESVTPEVPTHLHFRLGAVSQEGSCGGGGVGSGTGTPPRTPALPQSHSWREGGDPSLRRPELPPGLSLREGGREKGHSQRRFCGLCCLEPTAPGKGRLRLSREGAWASRGTDSEAGRECRWREPGGSEGARSQDPNAPPQGEASSWLRGTDQRCRSEQRHLRS